MAITVILLGQENLFALQETMGQSHSMAVRKLHQFDVEMKPFSFTKSLASDEQSRDITFTAHGPWFRKWALVSKILISTTYHYCSF